MPNLCIFPARALKEKTLTPTDLWILAAIGTHTDRDGAGCWANSKTLAEEADVSPSTFFASTRRLLDANLIERSSGQLEGKSSTYRVLLDAPRVSRKPDTGVSGQPDTPPPASRIPVSGQPDTPTINDPLNDPLNESSPAYASFITVSFAPDYAELCRRVMAANGHWEAWRAEMAATTQGMHGPARTPAEIGQSIRDFNGSGADISLRLFRGFLKGNGPKPRENGSSEALDGKKIVLSGRRGGKTLAAAELVKKLKGVRVQATEGPHAGFFALPRDWKAKFDEAEVRVIDAIGTERLLESDPKQAGIVLSQLAKSLEEV